LPYHRDTSYPWGPCASREAFALPGIIRQEDHADAIFNGISQVKTQPRTGILKKRMRDLYEYPGAIASIFFATASATVIEILQDCQCLLDDFA